LTGMPVLSVVPVERAMAAPRVVIRGGTSVGAARRQIERAGVAGAPVIDEQGRFAGTVALPDLPGGQREVDHGIDAYVDATASTVADDTDLGVALDALASATGRWVTVLDADRQVRGTLGISDVVRGYRLGLLASLQEMGAAGTPEGTDRVSIETHAPLVGRPLRYSGMPMGVIVTTLQRQGDLIVPRGDTVLETGDELVLIGRSSDIAVVREAASGTASGPSDRRSTERDGHPPDRVDGRAG